MKKILLSWLAALVFVFGLCACSASNSLPEVEEEQPSIAVEESEAAEDMADEGAEAEPGAEETTPAEEAASDEVTPADDEDYPVSGGLQIEGDDVWYEDAYIKIKSPYSWGYVMFDGLPTDADGRRVQFWEFNSTGSRSFMVAEITIGQADELYVPPEPTGKWDVVGNTAEGYPVILYAVTPETWQNFFDALTIKEPTAGEASAPQGSSAQAGLYTYQGQSYAGQELFTCTLTSPDAVLTNEMWNMGGALFTIREGERSVSFLIRDSSWPPYPQLNVTRAYGDVMVDFAWEDDASAELFFEISESLQPNMPEN